MVSHGLVASAMPTVLISLLWCAVSVVAEGMFVDRTPAIPQMPSQLNYGVAVTNVGDGDGPMEWVVAGFSGPNLVLQYDPTTRKYRNLAEQDGRFADLRDPEGAAIGVCACDIDGDGLEEIYFLNTNNRYSGPKLVRDRLFKWRNNRYEDLFSDDVNAGVSSMFSGRSVACVDRTGSGKYGILLATYAQDNKGAFGLIEMNEYHSGNDVASGKIVLENVAETVGIVFSTGGRGIAVGPIIGDDGFSDIYFVNEGSYGLGNRGDNALFVNDGRGFYTNMASDTNLNDPLPGRGVTLADFNNDGKTDIVYGNWMGYHRLQIQDADSSPPTFFNAATRDFAKPSPIRTVIAADFDNTGTLNVFMNNIVNRGAAPNKLYNILPEGASVGIVEEDIGDAEEPMKHGTGAAVADIDQDGVLELLVAHGESKKQGLTFYHVARSRVEGNKWLRVLPRTQFGAPARGAKVTLSLSDGRKLTHIVDGGSGYLCEMEPVAHFGIGHDTEVINLKVVWPDNHEITKSLTQGDMNKLIEISHSGSMTKMEPAAYMDTRGYDTKIGPDGRDSAISQVGRGSWQAARGRRPYRPESSSMTRSSSYSRNSRLGSNTANWSARGERRRQSSKSNIYDRERERERQISRAEEEKKRQEQREAELVRARQLQRRRELEKQRNEAERRRRLENKRRSRLTDPRETAPRTLESSRRRRPNVRPTPTTEDPRIALRRIARERARQRAAYRRGSYYSRRTANSRQNYNARRIYRGRTAYSTARPYQYRSREYYRRLAGQRREAARKAEEQRRRSGLRRTNNDGTRESNRGRNAGSRRRETAQSRYEQRYRPIPQKATMRPTIITKTTASPSTYDARRRQVLRNRYTYRRPRPTPETQKTYWGRRRQSYARTTTPRPTRRSYVVDRRRYYGTQSGPERYRSAYRSA